MVEEIHTYFMVHHWSSSRVQNPISLQMEACTPVVVVKHL